MRQARHTGWRAVSVTPDSDSIRDIYHTHGTVTNINRDSDGVVSHKYKFTASCCKVCDKQSVNSAHLEPVKRI